MGKYIHLFSAATDFNAAYKGDTYNEPWVSLTEEGEKVNYNKSEEEKLKQTYLTFNVLSDGDITWSKLTGSPSKSIQYRKNGGEWTSITSNTGTSAPKITVTSGDTIEFKGDNTSYASQTYYFSRFGGTANFNVKGNIMSLINSTSFSGLTELSGSNNFIGLFNGCTTVIDASKLLLPSTNVPAYGYYGMFAGCTSLTLGPELPATTLNGYCYQRMFSGCTSMISGPSTIGSSDTVVPVSGCSGMFNNCSSLEKAPELPATTLSVASYEYMFQACTSLTTAPEIHATTLPTYAVRNMFSSCKSLTKAPGSIGISSSVLGNACCWNMFYGCENLTAAPMLPATEIGSSAYTQMFMNCTKLTSVPALPVTNLSDRCYQGMFRGCTSLTTAPALPATTLASYCYDEMFRDCTSLTSAPEFAEITLVEGCYFGMFSGCTSLVTAPELPATALAKQCYYYMFANCMSLTSAPAVLPGTDFSNAQDCYGYMFAGCTSLTTAPELPAQTVTKSAYEYMFQNCTNLNYIKCLATGNNIGPNYTSSPCYQWVANAGAPTGTFVKAASMTAWQRNNSGVPAGWTIQDA